MGTAGTIVAKDAAEWWEVFRGRLGCDRDCGGTTAEEGVVGCVEPVSEESYGGVGVSTT